MEALRSAGICVGLIFFGGLGAYTILPVRYLLNIKDVDEAVTPGAVETKWKTKTLPEGLTQDLEQMIERGIREGFNELDSKIAAFVKTTDANFEELKGSIEHQKQVVVKPETAGSLTPKRKSPAERSALCNNANLRGIRAPLGAPNALQSLSDLAAFAPDLVDVGSKLFGSPEQLHLFLQNTDAPKLIHMNGVSMVLKQSRGDNTVIRLQQDFAGDSYGISRITEKNGVLLDIGLNIGSFSIVVAKRFPQLQVLAAEPIPATYFLARMNLRLNGVADLPEGAFGVCSDIPGVLALQRAVASVNKILPMYYSIISSQDTLAVGQHDAWTKIVNDTSLRPDIGGTWKKADVSTLVLPQFLQEHGVEQVRFFKLDCEGCEYDMVPHMAEFFTDKTVVPLLAGELHPCKVAGAMDRANTVAFDQILRSRGCALLDGDAYTVLC